MAPCMVLCGARMTQGLPLPMVPTPQPLDTQLQPPMLLVPSEGSSPRTADTASPVIFMCLQVTLLRRCHKFPG